MAKVLNKDFVTNYQKEADWAAEYGIHPRTVARYRVQGLPFMIFGGYVWIPKQQARDWVASRVKRRNPPRRNKRQAATNPAAISP